MPASSLMTVRSWCTPVATSKSPCSCGYFTWKYDENALTAKPSTRHERAAPSPQGRRRRRRDRRGRTRPGTRRSRHRTPASIREGPGVHADERGRCARRCALGRDGDEPLRDVDADHLDPPRREREGVTARTTTDVEHALPRSQLEHVDEERDLLLGALRERVPQVRRTEMVGQRLEPVVGLGARQSVLTGRRRDALPARREVVPLLVRVQRSVALVGRGDRDQAREQQVDDERR